MSNIVFPTFQSGTYWERLHNTPVDFSKLDPRYLNSEILKIIGSPNLFEFWHFNDLEETDLSNVSERLKGSIFNRGAESLRKMTGNITFGVLPSYNFGNSRSTFRSKKYNINTPYFELNTDKLRLIYNQYGQALSVIKNYSTFTGKETFHYNNDGSISLRTHGSSRFEYNYHSGGRSRTIRTINNGNLIRNTLEKIDESGNIIYSDSPESECTWLYDENHNVIYETYLDKEEENGVYYYEFEYDEFQRRTWYERNEGDESTVTSTSYPEAFDPNITELRIEKTSREISGRHQSDLVVRYETHNYNDFIKIVRIWDTLEEVNKKKDTFRLNKKDIDDGENNN